MNPAAWRESVKLHPAADRFPLIADDGLAALVNDIAENGLQQPLTFWTAARPGGSVERDQCFLLDGRLAALELASPLCQERAKLLDSVLRIDPHGARLFTGEVDRVRCVSRAP